MAAPIGHIYLALKLLAGPLQGIDEQAFLVGTSFPDIRYWAHVSREYTHLPVKSFDEVLQEPDAFRAGMLFHSFVDNQRFAYFAKQPASKFASIVDYNGYLMKNTEDLVLFPIIKDKITDKNFIKYFDKIFSEETALIKNQDLVKQWHKTMQDYFTSGPTPEQLAKSFTQLAQAPTRLKNIAIAAFHALSKRLAALKSVQQHVLAFYDHFDEIAGTKVMAKISYNPAIAYTTV